MLNKTLDDMSVAKLKQLVASRFGKTLEVRQLMELSGTGDTEVVALKGHDLHIPIRVKDHYLGTAIVSEAWDLNDVGRQDISDMIRLILEPTMYNWYLERKENNLNLLANAQFPTENLQIFGEKHHFNQNNRSHLSNLNELLTVDEIPAAKPALISNLVHLEGKNIMMIKKVSLQIHDMTHRWAFVPFVDIRNQLTNALDISKMGAMTIFVEDVLTLTAKDQDLLLEYLATPRSNEEPLIITSSQLQASELKSSDLHPHLVDELEINSFEVDRAPLGYHNLKEVLELFFLREEDFKV